jgi:hypothetical protein
VLASEQAVASLGQPISGEAAAEGGAPFDSALQSLPMELLSDIAKRIFAQSPALSRVVGSFCANRVRFLPSPTSVKRESLLAVTRPNRPVCRK